MSEKSQSSGSKGRRNFRRTQGPQTKSSSDGKEQKNGKSASRSTDSDDEDEDVCLICAEPLHYVSLTPCNHKTCNKCAFRQLDLYEKKNCLICRTEIEEVVFTTNDIANAHKHNYSDVVKKYMSSFIHNKTDFTYINFTSEDVQKQTMDLRKFYCQLCPEDKLEDFGTYQKLHEHLRSEHNKALCMICATHKRAFPSELTIFTPNQLRNHQSRGDEGEGFKGHPMCAFCSGRRFYSDDELYLHMREKHEKCHICDKIDSKNPQYFKDYEQLFEHFKHYHYICTVPSCLEMKFVVFKDELELQAHILQEHGNIIRGKPKFFQSELSTFISTPSRVVREDGGHTNTSNLSSLPSGSSSNGRQEEPTESPEMKQLRLEERAKYYLDNSNEDYARFLQYNEQFDKSRLTALNLLDNYRNLFTTPQSDVYLLIRNLAETYPKNSKKYKDLNSIYLANEERMERQNTNNNLPSLSNDRSYSVPVVSNTWGGSGGTTPRSNIRNLPSLPTSNHADPFANPYKTKSFKSINRGTTSLSNSNSSSRTSMSSNTVSFTQSFADSRKPEKRATASSYAANFNTTSGSKNKLSQLNLPSLPTPKPKVVIPPVHKTILPNPKGWGKTAPSKSAGHSNAFDDDLQLDLSNLSVKSGNGKNKKKGNQKQLLFHIGI